jgi:hypothetical protein
LTERKGQIIMKKMNKFRRSAAIVVLSLSGLGATVGIASAQSTSTAATAVAPKAGGGGFNVHADTIAKTLGITAAQLQTELSSGKTVAQIATAKGVNLQTVIDAYVAEESAEHPDMAKADVVARVTASVNGVRPAGDRGRGQGGTKTNSKTNSTTGSTTSAPTSAVKSVSA